MLAAPPPRYRASYLSPDDVPRLQVTPSGEAVDSKVGKGHVIGFDVGEASKDRHARRDSHRWNHLRRRAECCDREQERQGDARKKMLSTMGVYGHSLILCLT